MSLYLRRAVIVDANSTGKALAPELLRCGVGGLHVQSAPALPEPVPLEDFERHFQFHGDVDALAAELSPLSPEFVIAGCEQGVHLADALSERLGLPGNGTALTLSRRNKLRLGERLTHCGLRTVPSFEVASADAAAAAATALGPGPLVVKPVDSSGSDGLRFCADAAAARGAAADLLGRVNFMGSLNRTVLVQQRIVGQQYYVLATSRDGQHFVSELWLDHRRTIPGAGVVCDVSILLPSEGALQDELRSYVGRCLDAVGIHLGPSFLEIILTDTGPVLIDLAARMMGTQDFAVIESVLGTSQRQLTALCYADPAAFVARAAAPQQARCGLWVVTLINLHRGRLVDESWRDRLAALPSYRSIYGAPKPGQLLQRTVDEVDGCGAVFLAHDDAAQIERDYQEIRALEADGRLFRLEPLRDALIE